jgi:flavin reductase (DIM6/NTAB) family NADH-FMN oxidoreductase RutF
MPIDPDQFRQTLGRLPTGITVVTFARPDGVAGGASPFGTVHGITVNSFTSLSLVPPLVGVAIDVKARPTRCCRRWRATASASCRPIKPASRTTSPVDPRPSRATPSRSSTATR